MKQPHFVYDGVLHANDLPDYMDDLHGYHVFYIRHQTVDSDRIFSEAKNWCLNRDFKFERMSNQIFIADQTQAFEFRLRWC